MAIISCHKEIIAVNLLYLLNDDIIRASPKKLSAGDYSFWWCTVAGSIQCTVIHPKKTFFLSNPQICSDGDIFQVIRSFLQVIFISIYALSKNLANVLRSGSMPPIHFPVNRILLMILQNVGASTADSGCINAATNLLSSVELIVLLGGEHELKTGFCCAGVILFSLFQLYSAVLCSVV